MGRKQVELKIYLLPSVASFRDHVVHLEMKIHVMNTFSREIGISVH